MISREHTCELDSVLIASSVIAAAIAIFIGSVCAAQGNPDDALAEYQKSIDRIASFDVSIDEEKPIDEELFMLSFPAGTRVRDEVRGTEFIAGAEE